MAKGLSFSIDLERDLGHELHPLEQAREMVRLHALRFLEHELDGDAVFRKAARSEGKRKEAAGGEESHHPDGSVRVFTGAGDAEEYGAGAHGKLDSVPRYTSNSASSLAAQMKSFSVSPPMACVIYFTRQLL